MTLPPEIMESIFSQLASTGIQRYVGNVNQTLITCFSVSKFVRNLAMTRIFHHLDVGSSISPRRLELLLSILEPSGPASWMSVRRFIQRFAFYIHPMKQTETDWALMHPFRPDDFVPLFLALSRGNQNSQLSKFVFTVAPFDVPVFTQTFEDVVLGFMKLPSLRSLEIHGRFFTCNFLLDTHIKNLCITRYGLDPDPLSRGVNSTSAFGFSVTPLRVDSDVPHNYPDLHTLETDLTWPRGIEARQSDRLFQNLTTLVISINISLAFKNAEVLIPKMKSLRSLTVMYEFDGYEEELPINWKIDFGELHALETLKFVWENSPSSERQEVIARGSRPLAGLLGILDTIHRPMLNLTTVHWVFRYATGSLPPDVLGQWMESDGRWDRLDQSLTSNIFPSLRTVEIALCPTTLVPTITWDDIREEENNRIFTDLKSIEGVARERRERTFPRLTSCLKDNLRVNGRGQMLLTDAGRVVSTMILGENGFQGELLE